MTILNIFRQLAAISVLKKIYNALLNFEYYSHYILFLKKIYRYALVLVDKTKELSKEKRRTDSLLYQMVPRQVAEMLKTHKGVESEYFKSVTILFSDICGFSQITLTLEPMNIVKLLNALYEAIDELLEAQNVYKVETINDSYMVASGL